MTDGLLQMDLLSLQLRKNESDFIAEVIRQEDDKAYGVIIDESTRERIFQPQQNIKVGVMDILVGGLGQNLYGKRID